MTLLPFPNTVLLLALAGLSLHAAAEVPPAEALARLQAGNARFTSDAAQHPHADGARRAQTADSQQPFAVILGCADSRTSPELIFDQGLGDLFVTRLAGNIVDDAVIGSIEFAVAKLGARLIIVLGHEKCGAVAAALQGSEPPGNIGALTAAIAPAVKKSTGQAGDPLENAIRENVLLQAAKLKSASKLLAPMLETGSVRIVGARYDLDTGAVVFFE